MRYALCLLLIGFTATATRAQSAASDAAALGLQMPASPQQPPSGPPPGQPTPAQTPTNIKLDLAITDTYGGTPAKKTVSMLIMTGNGGMIRTSNRLASGAEVKLNVDATARVHPAAAGYVIVQVTFEYTPAQARSEESAGHPAMLHESLHVVLQNGKPLVVSQSADPSTERRVTVELTGTILK
jgi:hypothetical protein